VANFFIAATMVSRIINGRIGGDGVGDGIERVG
jgi:hypothetical protein